MKDSKSRKWQITINNPLDKGYTHDFIREQFKLIKPVIYWCLSDEIGENQTYHTHVFIACSSAVRFSTIRNKFEGAHFEMAKGTAQQNREYVFKEGKWTNDKKEDTNLKDTHEEYGECPLERQGQRNDIHDLYDMIKQGSSDFEIIEENPNYLLNIEKVDRARQIVREEEFKNKFRKLHVQYLYGETGSGKTRFVMEKYGYSNVFRVTDYKHPFDSYKGQDVVIFEEFRSSLKIQDLLNYLDGYPLELPCRYANKIACFTKVYLITNIPFEEQFKNVQYANPETWNAFKRRIHEIYHFEKDTPTVKEDYFDQLSLL